MKHIGSRLLVLTACGLFFLLIEQNSDGFSSDQAGDFLIGQATAANDLGYSIGQSILKHRHKDQPSPDIVTGATEKPPTGEGEKNAKEPVPAPKEAPPLTPEIETADRTVLERLAARREALDKRDKEINEREALLAAAEKQIESRMAELKAMDEAVKAEFARKDADRATLKPLIVMYEAMKPKEAARIFEKLDLKSVLPIASGMNPKKFSEVLAQIDPVIAGKLTMGLSAAATSQGMTPAGTGDLPELADAPALKTR